jgi:hypothetical protein
MAGLQTAPGPKALLRVMDGDLRVLWRCQVLKTKRVFVYVQNDVQAFRVGGFGFGGPKHCG